MVLFHCPEGKDVCPPKFFNYDDFANSRRMLSFIIPAKAGIRHFQQVMGRQDSGFLLNEDFLRVN